MNHELYLSDNGIYKKNDIFFYNKTKERVLDVKILERISKIRVPPAWTSVWYASNKKCHIQVHGIDTSNKKQYILSDEWIKSSSAEKFNRMKSFNIGSFKRLIKLKSLELNFIPSCEFKASSGVRNLSPVIPLATIIPKSSKSFFL